MLLRNIYIVVNPISGIGKQKVIEQSAQKYIDTSQINYKIIYTEYPGHIKLIAADAVKNDIDILVAVGGDGTVNEAVHALVNTNTVLAIIPTGSGNGFARHLNIPLKIKGAIQLLNKNNCIQVDTIASNDYSFVNVAGFGFDGLVANKFATYGKRGLKSYVKIALKEYANYKNVTIEFIADNKLYKEEDLLVFAIANASQFGNNATIAPAANLQDGLMDIITIKPIPWYYIPPFTFSLFTKKLNENRYVKLYKARKVTIKLNEKTMAHIDGEPLILDVDQYLKVLPLSLKVLVP